jgi:hypothetical protein
MKPLTVAAALLTSLVAHAHGWWILGCGRPVVVERVDPIVNPGQSVRSDHLHSVLGGNSFASNLTYDLTQGSTCTTCVVTKDLSNYWTPTLYFRAQNGSFIAVNQVGGANIYYQWVLPDAAQDKRPPANATADSAWTLRIPGSPAASTPFRRASAW